MAIGRRNLKNNWSTTLQASAAAAATTLSLPQPWIDKLTAPPPSASEWYELTLDDGVQAPEIVRCTGKGTGTVTVVRQQQGTVAPTTWAAGTKVEIRATAQLLAILGTASASDSDGMVIIGPAAGVAITSGIGNSLFGHAAGGALTSGSYDTAFGRLALSAETTGSYNTAFGDQALGALTGGDSNSAFGAGAGANAGAAAQQSSFFGCSADAAVAGLSNVLCLGYGAQAWTSNTASIGSPGAPLDEIYIGRGQRAWIAGEVTLSATAGGGNNKNGGLLRLAGGKGTGVGEGGKVVIATAETGTVAGATEAAWTDRAEWDNAGLFWTYAGLKTGDPGNGAGTWKLGTVQAGAVTLDTANYVEVDIGGTVVKLLKAA